MKSSALISIFLITVAISEPSNAMSSNGLKSASCSDAFNALQLTRSSVINDLQQSMQSSLNTIKNHKLEQFGVDDVKSYAKQGNTTLGSLAVEG